jgi:hypothetical protein
VLEKHSMNFSLYVLYNFVSIYNVNLEMKEAARKDEKKVKMMLPDLSILG